MLDLRYMRLSSACCVVFLLLGCAHNGSKQQESQPNVRLPPAPSTSIPKEAYGFHVPPSVQVINQVNATDLMGRSEMVPLAGPVVLGTGYSTLTGQLRGPALVHEPASSNVLSPEERGTTYNLTYIGSYSELAKTLNVKASAKYGAASGSVSLFRQAKVKRNKAYILVDMTVVSKVDYLKSFALNEDALSLLRQKSAGPSFSIRYGDQFLASITYGGQLYALLEFSASQSEEVEELKAKVKGSAGSFSGSASMEQSLRSLTGSREVKIVYTQTGGDAGQPVAVAVAAAADTKPDPLQPRMTGGLLAMTPDELLERVRRFPGEVYSNSRNVKALFGLTRDYTLASNLPASAAISPVLAESWIVEDLSMAKALIEEELATIDDFVVTASADSSANPSDVEEARQQLPYLRFASKEADRMMEVVLAAPGSMAKIAKSLSLEKYDFYKRKRASKNALVPSQTSDLCSLIEVDSAALDECLFGQRRLAISVIPLDKIIVDRPIRIVVGQHSDWSTSVRNSPRGNARNIIPPFVANETPGCNFDAQAYANAHCQKSDPTDRTVRAVILPVPGASILGNTCGYNAYNVMCMRTTAKRNNIVAAASNYRDISNRVRTKIVSVGVIESNRYARAVIGVEIEGCSKTFGQFTVKVLGLSSDGVTRKTFQASDFWRRDARAFDVSVDVLLPDGWVPVDGAAQVELQSALCET